jgi:hypothetical protein
MIKRQLISKLLHERDKFELLLNRVGFARRMTMKGVTGTWSIKDIIAHIWAYEQYMADRLDEIVRGEVYIPCQTQHDLDAFLDEFGYPDFDSPLLDEHVSNNWIFEKYRNIPLEELVAQELQAFASIVSALEAMPEETIKQHNLPDRVADHTFHHYREHIKDIRAWLKINAVNSKKQ